MDIQYDPALIESVVLLEVQRKEGEGNLGFFKEYHSLTDPVYEMGSLEERDKAFQLIYQKLFRKWRLGNTLEETVREYPLFEDDVDLIYLKMASFEGDAGADLMGEKEGRGAKIILIKLLSHYFTEKDRLQNFLHHEFMHVSDILDKAFKYDEGLKMIPSPKNWVRERYSLLWDIYIDGRLSRQGKELMKGRDKRVEEFDTLYQKLPESQRKTLFEWFWNAKDLTHRDLLEMAQDISNLIKRTGTLYLEGNGNSNKVNIPGTPCPLCRFPTYYWEDDLPAKLEEPVIKIIQENHPQWAVEDGACSRCIECYSIMVEAMTN